MRAKRFLFFPKIAGREVRAVPAADEPELVAAFLRGHLEATLVYQNDPAWARQVMQDHILELTKKKVPMPVLERALSRLELTWDPLPGTLQEGARLSQALGFLRSSNLEGIYALGPLNTALSGLGLPRMEEP